MPNGRTRAGRVLITFIVIFWTGIALLPGRAGAAPEPKAKADPRPQGARPSPATTEPGGPRTLADLLLREAETNIRYKPADPEGYADLAAAFMGKARETADATYLARAEAADAKALKLQPDYYGAVRLAAWIYNGQHRFAEAKAAAERAIQAKPGDPWNYGTLGDALAELGEYGPAEDAYDRMMEIRPDASANARQSYMGELHGETDFALEAMRVALRASDPADPELVAWVRVRLGDILFNSGKVAEADAEYAAALAALPDYYAALAGVARVRAAQGRTDDAVLIYERSLRVAPTEPAIAGLIDLLTSLGRTAEAERQFALVATIRKIYAANSVRPAASTAMLYADHGRDLAESLATAEACAKEQQDVRTLDALAWVRFKNGKYAEAREAIARALRLGTRDALMHFHAGMIEAKLNHRAEAVEHLKRALEINPYFSPRHAPEARQMLRSLEGGAAGNGSEHP